MRKKSEIVVLHTPVNHDLVKTNRWLIVGVFALMTIVFIMGLFLRPKDDFLSHYEKVTAAEAYNKTSNPALSAEVNVLKGQLVGLVSGSIESKLNALEVSLQTGSTKNALVAIEALKNDVKVLRGYSEPSEKAQLANVNAQLQNEMTHLRHLIYLTIASCGLMLAAVAGIWLKGIKKLPSKETITRYLSKD